MTVLAGTATTAAKNSFNELIEQTRALLLSGAREEVNFLSANITDSAATLTLTNAPDASIRTGAILSIGTELMLVKSVAGSSVTVVRGHRGSDAAAHLADALVWVNPRFPHWDIWRAMTQELGSLASPGVGLFRITTATLTYDTARGGYTFTPTDYLSVYDVRADETDSRKMLHVSYDGTYLRVGGAHPTTVKVRYRAGFTQPTSPSDDVETVTGLWPEAHDILVVGAAARLVPYREVKRGFTEAQGDSRRAEEVPPGTSVGSARMLLALRGQRINEEVARLYSKYPPEGV